ncbi:MAG: HAMP domain-containing histidine kinase [Thauera sp.]|nr:HAMP domain-containing histidine kinase [Thauera sp.]
MKQRDPSQPTVRPQIAVSAFSSRAELARLLQLRWLSVVAMALIALMAFPLLAPAQPVSPLLGVMLVLVAANFALLAGGVRAGAFPQLAVDLVAWATFLYFGGGVTNPAISLLLPLVAVGAAMLPAAQAWTLAALAVAIYSLLWHFHVPVQLADAHMAMRLHLAGMWLSFALSAATVVWFVARMNAALARRERDLAAARAARARDAYVVGLGKLAAGAAHRLGTPLGTLRILVDELGRRSDLAAETREDVELMRRQIDDCRDILTSLTRDAGQQRAEQGGTARAGEWLDAVIARWRRLRPHAAVELQCDRAVGNAAIVADASLGEALHNLIDNGANANVASGRDGEAVQVVAVSAGQQLTVDVCDRGPGMPARLVDTLLGGEAQPGLTDGIASPVRSKGMGVGLLLAQTAVEHHGGALSFHPRPGGGTIARLTLPLQDASR